jgi:hypothetical protein
MRGLVPFRGSALEHEGGAGRGAAAARAASEAHLAFEGGFKFVLGRRFLFLRAWGCCFWRFAVFRW